MVSQTSAMGPKLSSFLTAAEEWLRPDYVASMIRYTLESRDRVSIEAREALDKTIQNSGVRVLLGGFRSQHAHRAPSHQLQGPVQRALPGSEEMVSALLLVWVEAQSELRELVVDYLHRHSQPMYGPDRQWSCFRGVWEVQDWQGHLAQVMEEGEDLNRDDVGLMLWYVSGKIPLPGAAGDSPSEGVNFPRWLDLLKVLPADAPQWEEARAFAATVCEMASLKDDERSRASVNAFQAVIANLRRRFADELNYLEQEAILSSIDYLNDPGRVAGAQGFIEQLEALLLDYRPIKDQATVRSEERQRAERRADLEGQILTILNRIDSYLSGGPGDDEWDRSSSAPALLEAAGDRPVVAAAAGEDFENVLVQTDEQVNPAEVSPAPLMPTEPEPAPAPELAPGPESSPHNNSPAAAAGQQTDAYLEKDRSLQWDNQTLQEENQRLKEELHHHIDVEEYWRHAYVTAASAPGHAAAVHTERAPGDVDTAIALAEERFPNELLFRLNSQSWTKNNPFEDPEAVLEALEWLATTYHRARTGEISVPKLDNSIYQACRWKYVSNQSDVTMGQYESHYRTLVDGQTYRLEEHIGRGNSKDPVNTIRVAFHWDKERRRVIVGYIGQHQRTDAT